MKSLVLLISLLLSTSVWAGIEVHKFQSPEQEALYNQLVDELRCLVCQNQNLADSNAELAVDLRKQVYKMITEDNASRDDVIGYMVTRYGDFVLYNPPVKPLTVMLWAGPALLLFLGGLILWRVVVRVRKQPDSQLDDTERAQVKKLLESED
ncbi:MAG: cytochrome c-type biogenesis protein [bacterium]